MNDAETILPSENYASVPEGSTKERIFGAPPTPPLSTQVPETIRMSSDVASEQKVGNCSLTPARHAIRAEDPGTRNSDLRRSECAGQRADPLAVPVADDWRRSVILPPQP